MMSLIGILGLSGIQYTILKTNSFYEGRAYESALFRIAETIDKGESELVSTAIRQGFTEKEQGSNTFTGFIIQEKIENLRRSDEAKDDAR